MIAAPCFSLNGYVVDANSTASTVSRSTPPRQSIAAATPMVMLSSSQLATAFSGPPGFGAPPPIIASGKRSRGMYAPYEVIPAMAAGSYDRQSQTASKRRPSSQCAASRVPGSALARPGPRWMSSVPIHILRRPGRLPPWSTVGTSAPGHASSMRRALAMAGIVLLAAGATVAWRYAQSSRPLNVVLIGVDTLRADHLGCYGYS